MSVMSHSGCKLINKRSLKGGSRHVLSSPFCNYVYFTFVSIHFQVSVASKNTSLFMLCPSTLNQITLNDPWTIFQLLTKTLDERTAEKKR